MKTYEEMAESVLERRDRYVADRKRKIRKMASMVSCVCFIAVLLTGIWYAGILNNDVDISNRDVANGRYQHEETQTGGILPSGAADAGMMDNDNEAKTEMSDDTLKNYDTVDKLLGDACALVKAEVLQANSGHVLSYIYTSYDMKVLDVVYGSIGVDGDIINVNMPGKTTDCSLFIGDEAYLFLLRESETSFAVVGEHRGKMLLENGNVIFDSNLIGFKDDVSAYGLQGGSMSESEFVEAINEL